MNADGENQLLMSIQHSLMTLLGEVGAVKQSIEHLVTNHDRLRDDMSKLSDRVDAIEKKQIASSSSWKGPQTLIGIAGAVVALVVGVLYLLERS